MLPESWLCLSRSCFHRTWCLLSGWWEDAGMWDLPSLPDLTGVEKRVPGSWQPWVPGLSQPFLWPLLYLFVYFGPCWVFVAVRGFSLVPVSWSYSSLWYAGSSLRWLLVASTGSRVHGLQWSWMHGLSCMWNLCGPGIKPVSPALAGGYLATGPPGKSFLVILSQIMVCV